ncbi:hypothetical protein CEXT_711221 [Caerostris extrusa]|uniref:Uncharacterized protein n=1 Tax=Caerostris extrusa TaxID=172846 RepID=A0AAV4PPB1_CAEEX|nr:hypothetical protein CEXT_711221 [Caerostris extrusa]
MGGKLFSNESQVHVGSHVESPSMRECRMNLIPMRSMWNLHPLCEWRMDPCNHINTLGHEGNIAEGLPQYYHHAGQATTSILHQHFILTLHNNLGIDTELSLWLYLLNFDPISRIFETYRHHTVDQAAPPHKVAC